MARWEGFPPPWRAQTRGGPAREGPSCARRSGAGRLPPVILPRSERHERRWRDPTRLPERRPRRHRSTAPDPLGRASGRGSGPGGRRLPAGQDRPEGDPRRRVGDHACPRLRPDLAGGRARGAVRPRGGRRWHQRPGRRALLPPAQTGCSHPDPGQPRRLRWPRETERVRGRGEGPHWLRGHGIDRHPLLLRQGGETDPGRHRHRHRQVLSGLRPDALFEVGAGQGHRLRPGELRPAEARDRIWPAPLGGVRGARTPQRSGTSGLHSRADGEGRLPPRALPRGDDTRSCGR